MSTDITINEPQITDFYNEEPNGVKIINGLNDEFDDLYNELIKIKKIMNTYKSFYILHGYLRIPPITEENRKIFEEFLEDKFEYIEYHSDHDILTTLCNSIPDIPYTHHPDDNPQSEHNHIYWISRKLNKLTEKHNNEACEYYIKTKLGELAVKHMNWICDKETIIKKFMEGFQ